MKQADSKLVVYAGIVAWTENWGWAMNTASKVRSFAKALVTRTLEFKFEKMPYRLENVSSAKLATMARCEFNSQKWKPGAPAYPAQLQIETSGVCTLQCPLCPAGMGAIDAPRGTMKFDTFKSLLDEVGDHAVIAVLWMWGEPFVNPRITDMITYAHRKNVATVASTNGQHIQTSEDAERLAASGLDNLIVAMDGVTQETYSTYRVGGDVQRIFRCLRLIREAKDRLGSVKPLVNVRTVVMKHNEHELPAVAAIARKYGADMVSKKMACLPDYYQGDADSGFAPNNPNYQRFHYKDGQRIRLPDSVFHCRRPWRRMTVTWDGTVLPCELDYGATLPLGRGVDGGSFTQTWFGKEAMEFREQFICDRTVYKFCRECHFRDRGDSACTVEPIEIGSSARTA